jgi:hypothetical protein
MKAADANAAATIVRREMFMGVSSDIVVCYNKHPFAWRCQQHCDNPMAERHPRTAAVHRV